MQGSKTVQSVYNIEIWVFHNSEYDVDVILGFVWNYSVQTQSNISMYTVLAVCFSPTHAVDFCCADVSKAIMGIRA
jgi:hypothetical protein